jgi:hypothetical protein
MREDQTQKISYILARVYISAHFLNIFVETLLLIVLEPGSCLAAAWCAIQNLLEYQVVTWHKDEGNWGVLYLVLKFL